jgi:hypothetical protein
MIACRPLRYVMFKFGLLSDSGDIHSVKDTSVGQLNICGLIIFARHITCVENHD